MNNNLTIPIPAPATKPPRRTRLPLWFLMLEFVEAIGLAAGLLFGANMVTSRVRVENISMQPTLHDGQLLLVNRLAYQLGHPQHGDIIIFHHYFAPVANPDPQTTPHEDYVKRVIGLPGDQIRISAGIVYVNGIPLEEEYEAAPPHYNGEWDVPAGSFFVLGDNRNWSSDSHEWGFVPLRDVIGKAELIYWPLTEIRLLGRMDVVKAAQAQVQ